MSDKRIGPLGILGGTFDPVHRAHLQLARDALEQLGLAQVLWIPSSNPPHRNPPLASAEQRLAMVALAIKGHDHFVLDGSEVRSTEPSYSVNTLQRLRHLHGARSLVLLLGADAFLNLESWHRWHDLFTLAHIAVATRPGYVLDTRTMNTELREETQHRRSDDLSCLMANMSGSIIPFAMTPLEISASTIREKLVAGEATTDLLPKTVLDYIADNHLYSYQTGH